MPKYHQGKYTPKNPEKYVGDVNNIIYRSGWEKKMFIKMDTNPNVLKWGSEEIIVPYVSPVDGRVHRYFVDLVAMMKTRTGKIIKVMMEIKPLSQTIPPKRPSRITKRYLNEIETYAINNSKWEAARKFAEQHNMTFELITENDLGV